MSFPAASEKQARVLWLAVTALAIAALVIVAVLAGTSLLGGIGGGILASPLAAALRAVLNR